MTLYNLGNVGTCLRLESPVTRTNLITAYFRIPFSFGGDPSHAILLLNGKFDDGGRVFLNGDEQYRAGLPLAPAVVGHTTLATRGVGDADAQDTAQLLFPAPLRRGQNQLAASLHQNGLTSSDLTFGLRIVALTRARLITAGPRLTITQEGGNVRIRWSPSDTGTLQSTAAMNDAPVWQDVTTGQVGPGEYLLPAAQASRFYSLR